MKAMRRAELHGNGLIRRDLWIADASGEQAHGCADHCERSNCVPGDLTSKADVHLSPFRMFGVFPGRIQHRMFGHLDFIPMGFHSTWFFLPAESYRLTSTTLLVSLVQGSLSLAL